MNEKESNQKSDVTKARMLILSEENISKLKKIIKELNELIEVMNF